MKPLVAVISVLALSWLAAANAEGSQGQTQPSMTTPATAPAEQADEETLAHKALIEAAKKSFVIVKIWYKKDTSEPVGAREDDWQASRLYEEYVDKKRCQEQTGIVLDDKGHVLIPDEGLEDRFLDRLEIESITGEVFPATREKLLFDTPGVLLKADAEAAAKLNPLEFADLKESDAEGELLTARLDKREDHWRIYTWPLKPAVEFSPGRPKNAFFGHRGRGALGYASILADSSGTPVGCAVASFFDLQQKESLWKGPDLRRADGIRFEKLAQLEDRCRKQLTQAAQEVVITLHQGGQEDAGPTRYTTYPEEASGASGKEINLYGVAISPTEILVPAALDRTLAARIDKIFVKLSAEDRLRADFVGVYKDFGAFVVRLRKGALPSHAALAEKDPPPMRPFWVARIRKKFGDKYVDLVANRMLGKQRGYAGEYHWYAAQQMQPGSLLVDFGGRLAGLYLLQRIEHEEERQLERGPRRYYYRSRPEQRIFTISELRDGLVNPVAHMDPKIEVKPRMLAKRRAWFGVESVAMSSDLAEQMKVEKPTKDGQLGFLVNAVYANSPAEKLGIQVGDILLKLKAPGVPYPIELRGRSEQDRDYGFGRYWRQYEDDEEQMMGPLPPSWKSRANFLTRALDAVGVGKEVTFTYYRPAEAGEGKTVTVDYKIELAPPDFDSAPKWINRKIGLTVKDLTYEIRHALNLKADDPGVIVAKVEHGSPMVIARIFPNEIVTRLDDKPITSARQMRDLIAEAQKSEQKKVRLTVLRLGKTRFADLNIATYDPKDDEGLDEEEE